MINSEGSMSALREGIATGLNASHLVALVGHPNCTVDLEATAKTKLPYFVAPSYTPEAFNVGQHIPTTTRNGTGQQAHPGFGCKYCKV